MSYGLQIKNGSNNIIIDEAFKNFQIVAIGTSAAGTSLPITGNLLVEGGLVFAKPSGVNTSDSAGWHIGIEMNFYSAHTGQFDVNLTSTTDWSGVDRSTSAITSPNLGKQAPNIDWIYIKPSATPTSTEYGLEVYAADGTMSFSSEVSGMFNIISSAVSNPSSQVDFHYYTPWYAGSGRNVFDCYVCIGNFLHFHIGQSGNWGWGHTAKWQSSGNKLTLIQPAWPASASTTNNFPATYLMGQLSGN